MQEEGKNELAVTIQREEFSLATSTTVVDVDIAFPGQADLELVTKAGTTTVTDAYGQLVSTSKAGTITVWHSHLQWRLAAFD